MSVFIGADLIIVAFLLFTLICVFSKDDESAIPCAILGAFTIVLFMAGVSLLDNCYNPSIEPIDVYRGKTTLEITYRDSVAVDSVVVWKDETK